MKLALFVIMVTLFTGHAPPCLHCGQSHRGLLISAFGLPGTGKSTVMRELATLLDGTYFCEPNHKEYPDAVRCRELSGDFTMITWFRTVRLPQLMRANQIRASGEIALTDSYYDKLLAYYIGKPGMEWLINPSDPYFDIAVAMAKRDWDELPNADVIVFFETSLELWEEFKRNNYFENDPKFLLSFSTQEFFLKACQKLASEKNITLIVVQQEWSSPKAMAIKIRQELYDKGILHKE